MYYFFIICKMAPRVVVWRPLVWSKYHGVDKDQIDPNDFSFLFPVTAFRNLQIKKKNPDLTITCQLQ